jgi:hypothetical protein
LETGFCSFHNFSSKNSNKKMSNWAIEAFGEQLVTKDGVKNTADVLANKSRVALYFSAHWVCRVPLITLIDDDFIIYF